MMIKLVKSAILFSFFVLFAACQQKQVVQTNNLQVAFLADVHLQNIYGQLNDSEHKGVLNPGNSQYVLARTMESQLRSTRLFNENYFAFLAALDDIARRGVKYVVLPGDFSDDGQPLNIRGLRLIMQDYATKYGINFLATTGNHDPVRPFSMDAGKSDFMGQNGQPQALMSKKGMYKPDNDDVLPAVITHDIRKMGYSEIINELADFGFFPKKTDLYWETPFTTYGYQAYSYAKAAQQSDIGQRTYPISPGNVKIPDVSYLVEPIENVWFLAIDANVYIPKEMAATDPENPSNYNGASVGYNQVLSHKRYLIDWVRKVTNEAHKRGKILIVFSHYPMVEFTDGATEHIEKLMGKGKMQLSRVPGQEVSSIFADAGITLHFGGHMHINDTGVFTGESGKTLVNVQIPSLAAYVPAYKLLTVKSSELMEVETIVLDSVPRFKELFPLYEMEHRYLVSKGDRQIWDKGILTSKSYREFTMWHLKELVRMRFIPDDWPDELAKIVLNANGQELLKFVYNSQIDSLVATSVSLSEFGNWTGFDLVYDIYRIHSADQLAFGDIGQERLRQYKIIMDGLIKKGNIDLRGSNLRELAKVFNKLTNGAPSNHFIVNLKTGEVTAVE